MYQIKKAAGLLLRENRSLIDLRPIATVEVAARKAGTGSALHRFCESQAYAFG